METFVDAALKYLECGLSVVPANADKIPTIPNWKKYQKEKLSKYEVSRLFLESNEAISIICGEVSGNLEVIDIDTRQLRTESLLEELNELILCHLPNVHDKLVRIGTKSGGMHLYYRCSQIGSHLRLAKNLFNQIIIETRGEGCYVVAPPTKGYYFYSVAEFNEIPTITPEERVILHRICQFFNVEKVLAQDSAKDTFTKEVEDSHEFHLSSWDDYNLRGDIIGLMESNGWIRKHGWDGERDPYYYSNRPERIYFIKEGTSDPECVAHFDVDRRTFRIFSSATEFDPSKTYSPSSLFSILECKGNIWMTKKRLLELGFGEHSYSLTSTLTEVELERIWVELIDNTTGNVLEVINSGKSMTLFHLHISKSDIAVVHTPGSIAVNEVVKIIELLSQTDKRIYIAEDGREQIRSYKYQLQLILEKFDFVYQDQKILTDKQYDEFLDQVVRLSSKIESPLDKDMFVQLFLSHHLATQIGISRDGFLKAIEKTNNEIRLRKIRGS